MAVLQKGKAIYPFWGESVSIITGLDPLGLQLTSEATYATMLPGISNLTNRLRYYGFYCWLLDFYFQKEKKGNSVEQYRFIRRAELMIALTMQSQRKDVRQITGSNFAANLLNDLGSVVFDLAKGADKDKGQTDVYWKYPSGAFGQYYFGAMQALSLVGIAENEEGDFIYNITEPHPKQKISGKQLAEGFNASLTPEIKTLFYNNIKQGKLSVDEIPLIVKYFSIDIINVENQEWNLYIKMLTDKDDPSGEIEENFTFHRKETISSLINTAKENNNEFDWYQFLLKCYKNKFGNSDKVVSETDMGWYCYQLNEYWQYSCGTLFWSVLQYLYEFQQDQYLLTFIKDFTNSVYKTILNEEMSNFENDISLGGLISCIKQLSEEEIIERIEASIKGNDPISAAKNGFLLLFQLCRSNSEQLHPLKEFMSRKQIIREGNMADGLLGIHNNMHLPLFEFIEHFFVRNIIYRHQMVAMRKMGNGTQSTHKFFIEDQYIRFIDTFPPRNTSPRMNALWNLLYDLQIMDKDNLLCSNHEKILLD